MKIQILSDHVILNKIHRQLSESPTLPICFLGYKLYITDYILTVNGKETTLELIEGSLV